MSLFVDTSVWYAAADAADVSNRRAKEILTAGEALVTTDHVLVETWAMGADFPDQDFSLVDRTSFAVMQRLGCHRAASFDAHFSVYRFGARRARGFEVVR